MNMENDNWLSDRPLYQWFGIKVNTDRRVTAIHLRGNQLKGTLPPEMGELDQLQLLDVGNASLSGVIPREFGRLTQLQELVLDHNDLTGPIPHEIGLLPSLRYINLAYNRLSGEVPPSLMESESLEDIDLGDNALTGSIPSVTAQQSQIRHLRLSGNQLTGEIPDTIERARHLVDLVLSDNQLSGEIPTSIAQLQHLARFSASNNLLTGQIPDMFTRLLALGSLDLDDNRLTGTIPDGLGNLQELTQLSIAGNDFSGCIPSNLRDVDASNINFANIPVCGDPERSEPVVPPYINLDIADTATPAQTLAIELATQWLNDFTSELGWTTPKNTITVHADNLDGLVKSYADHIDGCSLECARYTFDHQGLTAEKDAVFIPLSSTQGNALEELAVWTARETFNAILLQLDNGPTTQGNQRAPDWWTYGLITFVGELAIADGINQPRNDRRGEIHWATASSFFLPLHELEEGGPWGQWHPLEATAIGLLASQVGLRKLTEFYTQTTDGEDWRQTFQRVFNISVPDFYERFNQYHRDGFPLEDLPTEGSTDWP